MPGLECRERGKNVGVVRFFIFQSHVFEAMGQNCSSSSRTSAVTFAFLGNISVSLTSANGVEVGVITLIHSHWPTQESLIGNAVSDWETFQRVLILTLRCVFLPLLVKPYFYRSLPDDTRTRYTDAKAKRKTGKP